MLYGSKNMVVKIEKRKKLERLKCLRCGHEWIPRKDTLPLTCAGCSTPFWNRERIKEKKKAGRKKDD